MRIPLVPVRFLYRAVDLYGKKTGVVSGDRRFTYAEFGERCERLAAGLIAEGVKPGDRVAYLSFNNHQLLEGYYGAPLCRSIVMPLNVRLTPAELTEIIRHSEARVLFFESDFAPYIDVFRKSCPSVKSYVELNEQYESLLTVGRVDRPEFLSLDEDEIAELFYTSGSTGTPKGVLLANRTLYLHAMAVTNMYGERDHGVELHTIPLFHANGWGRPQTATMNGIKHVMVRRFDPTQVFRLIEQERANSMSLVPTMANALLNCPDRERFDLSSLEKVIIGGAASSPELISRLEQALGCLVMGGYGLTETAPAITCCYRKSTVTYKDDADRLRRLSMAGWPLQGTQMRVVNSAMQDVARDGEAVGELLIRSDSVMDGYFKDPEGTAAAMSGAWLHTGDMATWDEDYYVQIVDRKKDIIISGGENIASIEIEKAIFAHPSVLECAVVAAPDDKWGEVPVALITLKPQHTCTREELFAFLEGRLAKFKLPRIIEFRAEQLPKTGTGKILKRELREPFWVGKELRVQGG